MGDLRFFFWSDASPKKWFRIWSMKCSAAWSTLLSDEQLLPKTVASLPHSSVVSLIEIAKFSDRINEMDKNFQGSMFNLVALFFDFIPVLLQIVGESM
jgi:hypothetical protein